MPQPYVVDERTSPSSYFMMPVDLYGTVVRVPVPATSTIARFFSYRTTVQDPASETFDPDAEEDGPARCRCLSGATGCQYDRQYVPVIGTAEWCEAGACANCQMNF